MRQALHHLASDFDAIAVPADGKYLRDPAKAGTSDAYRPA